MKDTKIDGRIFLLIFFITCLNLFAQAITKGPYLAEPKNTSIIVRWESDVEQPFVIKYGTTNKLRNKINAQMIDTSNNRYLYEGKIENLVPNKKYFYQVVYDTLKSNIIPFKCNITKNKPLTFVVTGDSRSNAKIFDQISEGIENKNPDLIINVGDIVRNGGNYKQWDEYFFNVVNKLINHIPFLPSVGDHEASKGGGDEGKLFTYFFMPHKNYKKLWYSYDYGNAHFVVLDYRYPEDKEMIEWFKKDMSNSHSEWNFVYMHRPSYNLGGHCSAWGREIWPRLFSKYNIDIVFAGHSHLYERFYPVRPNNEPEAHAVTYITSGGSGAPLYKTGASHCLAFAKSVHHYIIVKINNDKIELTAYKKDGSILDKISWEKNSESFDALVKSQDELDIVGMLMHSTIKRIKRLPMIGISATMQLKFNPVFCSDTVTFKISLAEESKKTFEMEEVIDTVSNLEAKMVPVKIFAKGDMTVTKWGKITPKIRLKIEYSSKKFKGTVISKAIEYEAY